MRGMRRASRETLQDKREATILPGVWRTYSASNERTINCRLAMQQGKSMSKSKPKTKSQQDRATDLRLQKTYNITLREYEQLLRDQGGVCAISGKPAGTRRLHVDHDHSWKKIKIETQKLIGGWSAEATYNNIDYVSFNTKKSLAVRQLKRKLLRASVRGLLAYTPNAGLQKFSDDPKMLRAAADYLENFQKNSPFSRQEG